MCRKLISFVIFSCFLLCASCDAEKKDSFKIAAASNMQFVIYELVDAFTKNTGIESEVILGSSGKLTAQIIEGAPFDLFLSADIKFPNELYNNGFALDPPEVYAFGSLILWTLKDGLNPILDSLKSEQVKHIAIGNPKTAPYGVAAMQVLKRANIYDFVNSKIVFGESVSQTNQFIISEAADLGFTSKSVVLSSQMKNKGSWKLVDRDLYEPMAQAMVVLNNRKTYKKEALQFREFILSLEGKKILHKFGYDVID